MTVNMENVKSLMLARKIRTVVASVVVLVTMIFFLIPLVYKDEVKKLMLICGVANPGDTVELQTPNGNRETYEFVTGDPRTNPLRIPPNTHLRYGLWGPNGERISGTDYFFDKFGRRIVTETSDLRVTNKWFALFFGSNVNDIPFLFSQQTADYRSYNYFWPLADAQYVNRMIDTIDFNAEVPEKKGLLIYVLSDNDYPATIGKFFQNIFPDTPQYRFENTITRFFGKEDAPSFLSEFNKNKLTYSGTIKEVAPLLSVVKKYAGLPTISNFYNNHIETTYTSEDHYFFCALIKRAQINFLHKFPGSRFILLMNNSLPDYDRQKIFHCARVAQVEVVDALGSSGRNKSSTYSTDNKMATESLIEYLKVTRGI